VADVGPGAEGTPAPVTPSPGAFCGACGTAVQPTSWFCGSCGAPGPAASPEEWAAWNNGRVTQASATPAATAPVAASVAPKNAGAFAIAGGITMIAGSFLPWATATAFIGTLEVTGIDGGDGWITVIFGLLAIVVGARTRSGIDSGAKVTFGIVGALTLALFLFEFSEVSSRVARAESVSEYSIDASVGVGLWLVGLAGVLMLIACHQATRDT
jgi:hypothetical protein